MQAVRLRPTVIEQLTEQHQPHDTNDHDDLLPAPPLPFPAVQTLFSANSSSSERLRILQLDISAIQQSCAQALSALLPTEKRSGEVLIAEDQLLASALIDLLEACYELETLSPSNASLPVDSLPLTASSSSVVDTPTSHAALAQQHLSDLLIAAQSHTVATACRIPSTTQLHAASNVVSEELVWARIETLTRAVLDLVRERTERISLLEAKEIHTRADEIAFEDSRNNPFTSPFDCAHESDTQLPRYSQNVHFDDLVDRASLPSYDDHTYPYNSHRIIDKKEDTASLVDETSSIPISSRKMSPSFNMLTEMNASSSKSRSDKEDKMRQLEEIWEGIERAHGSKRFGEHPRRSSLRDGADVISMKHDQLTRALPDQADTTGSRDENSASRLIEADLVSTQELGERDYFLRDLLNQSTDGRLADQDAVPPEEVTARHKQQAFSDAMTAGTTAGRSQGQDFRHLVEGMLARRREDFFINLVDASSSGRLQDQDSLPPNPKVQTDGMEDPFELVTLEGFFKTRRASEGTISATPGLALLQDGDTRKTPTGIKKIIGIVRRGSLGLGLKANMSLDLASVSYIAEHQENLRAVQVMLHGAGSLPKHDLHLEMGTPQGSAGQHEVMLISMQSASSLRISLPTAVYPAQRVPLESQDLHLEAKLSALPSPPGSSSHSIVNHALSATELRNLQPKALCCATCDREIADLSTSTVYKDLPSEHWAEMIEVWMCHADPKFTARIAQQTRDGFWPNHSTVLVGGSYLLVDSQQAQKHNIVRSEKESGSWRVSMCACGAVLGKQRPDDGQPGAGTLRISKWAIALLRDENEGESVESFRIPFSVFIVSDMLQIASSHASYRFSISDEDSGERRLLIWLFNPSVRISYRQASSSSVPSPHRADFTEGLLGVSSTIKSTGTANPHTSRSTHGPLNYTIKAAKIMYKVSSPLNLDSGEIVSGFGPGCQVEELKYPRDICSRLVTTLRESTSVYPVARRTMGDFDVGFLERT